jgi:hypothetical protein
MSLAVIDVQFTNEKYVFVNLVFGFHSGRTRAAVQEYRRRFLNRRRPNRAVVFNKSHCELWDLLQ